MRALRAVNGQIAAEYHRAAVIGQRIDGGEQIAHSSVGGCAVAGAAALDIDHITGSCQNGYSNGQHRDQRHDQAKDPILLHFHNNRSFFRDQDGEKFRILGRPSKNRTAPKSENSPYISYS